MTQILNFRQIVITILRYFLGMIMLAYGLLKIFKIQFVLPLSAYSHPLGEIDGVTLTWAFLGHTRWFSVVLGFLELVPGTLLLFRKTFILGALLIFPSLLSIFLINLAYGFFPHMQLFTFFLGLIDLGLLFSRFKLFKRFFYEIMEGTTNKGFITELMINLIVAGLIAWVIFYNLGR